MPVSILEAMATGLPVVATSVGDVRRVVEEGETGLLVLPRRPDELAGALEELLVDPERRKQMGAAGRRRVERHFSATATAAAVDTLYRAVFQSA